MGDAMASGDAVYPDLSDADAVDALLEWMNDSIQADLDVSTEDSVDASMAWLSNSIQTLADDAIEEQNTRAAHGGCDGLW